MIKLFAVLALFVVAAATQVNADPNTAPFNVGATTYTFANVTTAASQILPRNPYRALLTIQNQGNASVIIKADSTISAANEGFILAPQASFSPIPAMMDAFYAKALSGTQVLMFIEGVK